MNRNWIVWIVIPVLAVFLFGCPKKKPATPAEDLNVETTTVTPPPTTTPTQEVEQTAPSTTNDQTEDPLMSEDMRARMPYLDAVGVSWRVVAVAAGMVRTARWPPRAIRSW